MEDIKKIQELKEKILDTMQMYSYYVGKLDVSFNVYQRRAVIEVERKKVQPDGSTACIKIKL